MLVKIEGCLLYKGGKPKGSSRTSFFTKLSQGNWNQLRKFANDDTAESLTLDCTDSSWTEHPCLLHDWMVSHWVKRAKSQQRKQHHGREAHLHFFFFFFYPRADIARWSPNLFSRLHFDDRHLKFCWLETPWDIHQWTIKPGLEIHSFTNWHEYLDHTKTSHCHAYFKTRSEAGINWKHTRIQSYFPLISKPFGWMSWNSWSSTLQLADKLYNKSSWVGWMCSAAIMYRRTKIISPYLNGYNLLC